MKKRSYLSMFAWVGMASSQVVAQDKEPLNIVYILADDLGIGDLGCYGQEKIQTPNIDRMAAEGIRFTQHYSGASVSAPSRCSLLTGLHAGHSQVRGLPSCTASGKAVDLRDSDKTIADELRGAGYQTAVIGKWGLAELGMESMPLNRGFDYFYGYKTHIDAHHYYPTYLWENNEQVAFPQNDPDNTTGKYSNDVFTEKAIAYLDKKKEKPFFLYLAYSVPHLELTVPQGSKAPYQHLGWPKRPLTKAHYRNDEEGNVTYAGMVSRLDSYVGQIIDVLKKNGLDKNTIVMFSSDNGPEFDKGFFGSNGGFRGAKRDLYEGGIRAPFIAYCPGIIPAESVSNHVSAFWDMYPTFLDVAGVTSGNQTDGLSLLPTLKGNDKAQKEHRYLYWEINMKQGPIQALRMGNWKVVKFLDKPFELYDLSSDKKEMFNVADGHPSVIADAAAVLKECYVPHVEFPMDRRVLKEGNENKKNKK